MPQLDFSTFSSQIFWLIVSFLLMLTMMKFVVVPRISSIIEQRNRYIESYITKAEKLQKQALSSLEKYDQAIEKAKKEAEQKSKITEAQVSEFIRNKSEETINKLNEKISENEQLLVEQRNLALKEANKTAEILSSVILKKLNLSDLAENEAKKSENV